MTWWFWLALALALAPAVRVESFVGGPKRQLGRRLVAVSSRRPRPFPVMMSGASPEAFLAKPQFDLLALKSYRRETLLQYTNTQQSEPLRILLNGLVAVTSALAPLLASSLDAELGASGGAVAAALFVGSGLLFLRERGNRMAKLERLEKEYAAGDLRLRTRVAALPFGGSAAGREASVRELRGKARVVCVVGEPQDVVRQLREAAAYYRRFSQSRACAVFLVSEADGVLRAVTPAEVRAAGLGDAVGDDDRVTLGEWYATPVGVDAWGQYVDVLLGTDAADTVDTVDTVDTDVTDVTDVTNVTNVTNVSSSGPRSCWFALSIKGRSVGSGVSIGQDRAGEKQSLVWDQLLGDKLQPMELQSFTDSDAGSNLVGGPVGAAEAGVLAAQERFYASLTSGDLEGMEALLMPGADGEDSFISSVVAEGGRLDNWEFCLKEGQRPDGMKIGSRDAVVYADGTATSTCIEFPAPGLSMLATQKWAKKEASGWLMTSHRTIVYTYNAKAGGLLRCDNRGCAALTKSTRGNA